MMPGMTPYVMPDLNGYLFLLQRLGRVGAGSTQGLPEDGDYRDYQGDEDRNDIYMPCTFYPVSNSNSHFSEKDIDDRDGNDRRCKCQFHE